MEDDPLRPSRYRPQGAQHRSSRRQGLAATLVLSLLSIPLLTSVGSAGAQGAARVSKEVPADHPAEAAAATTSRLHKLEAAFTWIPAQPRVGEEVVFVASDQGRGVSYNWFVAGIRGSGNRLRWTPRKAQELRVRLQVQRGGERDTEIQSLTVAPTGPDPSGPALGGSKVRPASPCPRGLSCTYTWREDLGRHEVRRFRPSQRSTGNLDLEVISMPRQAP